MKQLFTSYFARSKKHPLAVCIAARPPWWAHKMKTAPQLAPAYSLVIALRQGEIDQKEYTRRYRKGLEEQDAQQIVDSLPEGAVLLCYETPKNFCHRHLAADWLRKNARVRISEL